MEVCRPRSNPRNAMLRPILAGVACSAASLFGGSVVFSFVGQRIVKAHNKRHAVMCAECDGAKRVPCRTCMGRSALDWQPLRDATVRRLTVCPTCDGSCTQACLNCLGEGTVVVQ